MATVRSNMRAMSASVSTTECSVKCRVEILHDQEAPVGVGDVIMPALADRDALVEILAVIERLPQLQDVGLALKRDAELPAHQAAAAVAADHVGGAQRGARRRRSP